MKKAHSSMPCSMMSFCCLMTSYCSGWSACDAWTLEETVESRELMLSRRPVGSGSFSSPASLSDGCSWPAQSHTSINYTFRPPFSCIFIFILAWTLTQVSLKIWIDIHVFAPLHHTFKDGHQTLQTFFTQAQLLWNTSSLT